MRVNSNQNRTGDGITTAYKAYMLITALVAVWIISTPILAHAGNDIYPTLYKIGEPICHQKISRSFCLFNDAGKNNAGGWSVGDCTPQDGTMRDDLRSEVCADGRGKIWKIEDCSALTAGGASDGSVARIGYKFPVSARDIVIYLGAFVGGIALFALKRHDKKEIPPAIWLILAIVPLGIDGTGQLLGFWESTNLIRAITGGIVGIAIAVYMIPMLNRIFHRGEADHNEKN